jgi:hypothetical protein
MPDKTSESTDIPGNLTPSDYYKREMHHQNLNISFQEFKDNCGLGNKFYTAAMPESEAETLFKKAEEKALKLRADKKQVDSAKPEKMTGEKFCEQFHKETYFAITIQESDTETMCEAKIKNRAFFLECLDSRPGVHITETDFTKCAIEIPVLKDKFNDAIPKLKEKMLSLTNEQTGAKEAASPAAAPQTLEQTVKESTVAEKTPSKAGVYLGIAAAAVAGFLMYLGITEFVSKPINKSVDEKISIVSNNLNQTARENDDLTKKLYDLQNDPLLIAKMQEYQAIERKCDELKNSYALVEQSLNDKNSEYGTIEANLKEAEKILNKLTQDYKECAESNNDYIESVTGKKTELAEKETEAISVKETQESDIEKSKETYNRILGREEDTLKAKLSELVKINDHYKSILEKNREK